MSLFRYGLYGLYALHGLSACMDYLTITQIQHGLRAKEFSSIELTRAHLDRITVRDGSLGAYLARDDDGALATAVAVDAAIASGDLLDPLAGVPIAVKDTILIEGLPCTAASKSLEPYRAVYDATAVQRIRAQRAVFLGKTNCDEFAMGSSTEHSALRKTVNPWDATRVPGGSSGGSAAAVATDLAVAALGSDTGGSIRQPAALSGVVGLKPTYGAVSRHGLIAMASSFDCIGPLTRTVEDTRAVFEAIRGRDPLDATSADAPSERRGGLYALPRAGVNRNARRMTGPTPTSALLRGLRIGVLADSFGAGVDPDVAALVRTAVTTLEGLGASVREIALPTAAHALAVYYVLMPAEVSANLERYDGIRYGASVAREHPETPLLEVYARTRAQGFGAEVKRRVMVGTYVLSKGYTDRYYTRALAVRNRIRKELTSAFADVDILVSPTSPTPAWRFGEKGSDPVQMYLADIFTVTANVAGVPALSVPCGFVTRDGKELPVGLQFTAPWFGEATLFAIGEAYEHATAWHERHPN